MSEPVVSDKRRFYRVNKLLSAEYNAGEETIRARIFVLDISEGGFRGTNSFEFPADVDLDFKIFLEKGEPPLRVKARVAWQRELATPEMYEIGFEFVDMHTEAMEKIRGYVEKWKKAADEDRKKTFSLEPTPYTRPMGT